MGRGRNLRVNLRRSAGNVGPRLANRRQIWSRSRQMSSCLPPHQAMVAVQHASRTVYQSCLQTIDRSGRRRLRRKFGAAGRKRHRLHYI